MLKHWCERVQGPDHHCPTHFSLHLRVKVPCMCHGVRGVAQRWTLIIRIGSWPLRIIQVVSCISLCILYPAWSWYIPCFFYAFWSWGLLYRILRYLLHHTIDWNLWCQLHHIINWNLGYLLHHTTDSITKIRVLHTREVWLRWWCPKGHKHL